MNIFPLSERLDPIESALMQCDKHILSQGKESCQILSNCFSLEALASDGCPRTQKGHPRKHSYPHHPCCKWVQESKGNFKWLLLHAKAQFEEFTVRYGKRHFSEDFVDWACENQDLSFVSSGHMTDFPVAISEDKKCRSVDGFDALPIYGKYRLFYIHDKPFTKWEKGRSKPDWFEKSLAT